MPQESISDRLLYTERASELVLCCLRIGNKRHGNGTFFSLSELYENSKVSSLFYKDRLLQLK